MCYSNFFEKFYEHCNLCRANVEEIFENVIGSIVGIWCYCIIATPGNKMHSVIQHTVLVSQNTRTIPGYSDS